MRNIINDYKSGFQICIKEKRMDFFLLLAFSFLVPMLMVIFASGLSLTGIGLLSGLGHPYVLGMFFFIFSLAMLKPLSIYYYSINGLMLVRSIERLTNHLGLTLFSAMLLNMYFSQSANENALYLAAISLSYTLATTIKFLRSIYKKPCIAG